MFSPHNHNLDIGKNLFLYQNLYLIIFGSNDISLLIPFLFQCVWRSCDHVCAHGSYGDLVLTTALPEQPMPTCEWAAHAHTRRCECTSAAKLAFVMVCWPYNDCGNLVFAAATSVRPRILCKLVSHARIGPLRNWVRRNFP